MAIGCASTPEDTAPALDAAVRQGLEAALDAPAMRAFVPGTVRVRLAFGPEADLDLFATDPRQETVYYGNTPAKSRAVLREDLRCDAPAPRIEVVDFPRSEPGRYRVGLDFPQHCGRAAGPVPFMIEVRSDSGVVRQAGQVDRGFHAVVLEFEQP